MTMQLSYRPLHEFNQVQTAGKKKKKIFRNHQEAQTHSVLQPNLPKLWIR